MENSYTSLVCFRWINLDIRAKSKQIHRYLATRSRSNLVLLETTRTKLHLNDNYLGALSSSSNRLMGWNLLGAEKPYRQTIIEESIEIQYIHALMEYNLHYFTPY